jgi:hypothetical protein
MPYYSVFQQLYFHRAYFVEYFIALGPHVLMNHYVEILVHRFKCILSVMINFMYQLGWAMECLND